MSDESINEEKSEKEASGGDGDEVISLEDLDGILEKEAPEFTKEMGVISSDEDLKNADVEVIDLESQTPEIEEKEDKPSFLDRSPRIKKIYLPIKNGVQKLRTRYKDYILNLNKNFKNGIKNTIIWVKTDLPGQLKQGKEKSLYYKSKFFEKINIYWQGYSKLEKKKKWALYGAIFLIGGTFYLAKLSIGEGWLPAINRPLLTSIEQKSKDVTNFDPAKDMVKFYHAFPQPEYFVLLNKVVVSLKRERSYRTPMVYAEYYLEVDAQETAVEIDDRMTHVLDVTQRALETFTYDEIQGAAGKAKSSALVRYEINKILNQGRVIRVFTKSFVTKP